MQAYIAYLKSNFENINIIFMILRDMTSEVRNTLKALKSSICVTAVFDMQYWEAEI